MKNFKFMMVLFVMIATLCITACESDKDDESVAVAPTCDPACAGDTECKCEGDKCACVDKTEKEECKCEPACTEDKECKCEGDKKECVEKPAEPKCEPACAEGKECKCEGDKCECIDSVKPTECTCDPVCSDGKVCKCEGDKKECVEAPAEPNADKK